jgi:hypothetical protein
MANRYWVGGTADWDATAGTKWATTSGGAGGAAVPTTADAVIFDAASGANIVTLGSGYNPDIFLLQMTGFTGTLAFGSQNISVSGTGTIYTGATTFSVTGTPVINCTNATATARTIAPTAVTEANAISFNITAGTGTVTINSSSNIKNLNFTGFAGTLANASRILYGNLIISSGMTLTAGVNITTFAATSGIQLITTNGKTLDFPITQNGAGGTVQLQDNLTMGSTRTYTLTNGALDLNNLILSAGIFNSNNSNTRSIAFGTGKIIVSGGGSSLSYWDVRTTTNFTYTGTSNVEFTYSGATGTRIISHGHTAGGSESNAISVKIIAGTDNVSFASQAFIKDADFTGYSGAMTPAFNLYGNLIFSATQTISASNTGLTIAGTSGTQQITMNGLTYDRNIVFNGVGGTFAFQDAFTQGSTKTFTLTNGTVRLKNGVTSTVGAFTTSGTNQKFLQSTTPGSTATLSQASGTVNASYLTIRDITAIGGATFNAYTDQSNVDAGNVEGWDFGISPIIGGAEYTYALRSFTQSRRF